MIDIENEVFSTIATELRARFEQIYVTGEEVRSPSQFPTVSIVEADNYVYKHSQDSGDNENHATVMYEINVYSNRKAQKKTECKEIFGVIDGFLSKLGFTRTMKQPVTMEDSTVYRLVGRYTAVVSKNQIIYGR